MQVSVNSIVLILVVHFVGDFVLQNGYMAINKSSNWLALSLHVAVYTLTLAVLGLPFALLNGAVHFVQDAITSRITAYAYKKEMRYVFFTVIGADQLLHYCLLFSSYAYLNGGS